MRNNIPLKIVGHGPLYDEMVVDYPNAEFLGYVQQGPALDALIQNARAVVLPSECYEKLLHGGAGGDVLRPAVVGARIGGIPEQIRHGVEGLLFEPGNAQDLADALDVMAENPAQAHEMGPERPGTAVPEILTAQAHGHVAVALSRAARQAIICQKKSQCWVRADPRCVRRC
ncbi:Glycosyl transferases group 1 [Leclercia adecarboxylata]|uniref:Glycosyl transferases group 1 n=1 Tax=Leclercia adecarboxylata TaxID=83655 RepID=A0A4U9HGF0_9ENTR|nr:Glycosyl transferases group 1 [Leclercia adecarboxylata]